MIHLTHSVSGSEIGNELMNDPEEAMYALEALADGDGMLIDDICDMISGQTAEKVSQFARRLADAIDNRN